MPVIAPTITAIKALRLITSSLLSRLSIPFSFSSTRLISPFSRSSTCLISPFSRSSTCLISPLSSITGQCEVFQKISFLYELKPLQALTYTTCKPGPDENHSQTLKPLSDGHSLKNFALSSSSFQTLKEQAMKDDAIALKYFEDSLEITQQQEDSPATLQVLLNAIPIYTRDELLFDKAKTSKQMALGLLKQLPNARNSVFSNLDVANLFYLPGDTTRQVVGTQCAISIDAAQVQELLTNAITIAQRIGDRRAESFALGALGHFYECRSNFEQALDLTQKARLAAENSQSQDSLYLWEWQAGRLLKSQGQDEEAIEFYDRAIATLESIRSDIVGTKALVP